MLLVQDIFAVLNFRKGKIAKRKKTIINKKV